MLEDLSCHILDIAENSAVADADTVTILLEELRRDDWLILSVEDDGRGMDEDRCSRVYDPFFTTRTTRRVGLGIPFLKQAAEACGGGLTLESRLGEGTKLKASFRYDHIDRPPMGDVASTLVTLLAGHPQIRWIYRHRVDDREFVFDSKEIVDVLEDREMLRTPDVAQWLRSYLSENLEEIGAASSAKGIEASLRPRHESS